MVSLNGKVSKSKLSALSDSDIMSVVSPGKTMFSLPSHIQNISAQQTTTYFRLKFFTKTAKKQTTCPFPNISTFQKQVNY